MAKSIVRITSKSYEELRDLDKFHLDLKKRTARQEDKDKFVVTGILNDDQVQQVKSAGYKVEILSDLSQVSKNLRNEVSKTNRFDQSKETASLKESAETGGYMNADEVETALMNINEAHPNITSLIDLPNRTWNGRLSRALYVHVKDNTGNKSNLKVILAQGY